MRSMRHMRRMKGLLCLRFRAPLDHKGAWRLLRADDRTRNSGSSVREGIDLCVRTQKGRDRDRERGEKLPLLHSRPSLFQETAHQRITYGRRLSTSKVVYTSNVIQLRAEFWRLASSRRSNRQAL